MTDPQPLAALDFLTHSKVRIAARTSSIWPSIVDPKFQGAQRLVHLDGEPGQVGERFHAVSSAAPDSPQFVVENVEVAAEQRRTIRLDGLDRTFMGFATWELTPDGSDTIVAYDVYCRYAGLPPGQSREAFMAAAQQGMDEGLLRLKKAIEQELAESEVARASNTEGGSTSGLKTPVG